MSRAAQLISSLTLEPHPEGGHYREVYRSDTRVVPSDGRSDRAALTLIHFLLIAGDVSRWHAVASDEVWHYVEGAPLELMTADPAFASVSRHTIGPLSHDAQPMHVVRAGEWQAAQSAGDYTLVVCAVAPGFDFSDFRMLADLPDLAEAVRLRHPAFAPLV